LDAFAHAMACVAKLLNLTGSDGEWETKTQRHKNMKLGSGGWHIPSSICDCLPKPECLFYGAVQGNEQVNIKLNTSEVHLI
jgi:hypothetical protein